MDIAAMSIGMHQAQLQQNISLALTKKVMDQSETQMEGLVQLLQTSAPAPHPTTGNTIDLSI
ncbi:YjfB family protein [Heyndrickxia oleronia]|uniref:YjfB family protein n=1 Tax=Heyndrickxia oleronia TaxID=38875 RepID=A0AAW6SWD3_9BACI|nr:YjfB family protein [Heyndrickxia oleronia]MCM3238128.1 YjfB family protein [Heyndrickxia oleronia]MDH5161582.1 YjfB family protein [Heyndrickxia oleronia]